MFAYRSKELSSGIIVSLIDIDGDGNFEDIHIVNQIFHHQWPVL